MAVYLGNRSCNVNCPSTGIEAGADGMTFVLSADPRGINAIGGFGGGLGVGPVNGGTAVQPSVVFEFDTFDNAFQGANDDAVGGQYIDHTGVYLNGQIFNTSPATTLIAAQPANNNELEDGRYHIAQFFWDPVTNHFRYMLDGVLVGEFTRNIRTDLGTNLVRFGFTGGTGGAWNEQKGCFTKAPNVLGSDLGDAPDSTTGTGKADYQTVYDNNGAIHTQADTDDNGVIDLRMGTLWDSDFGNLQNEAATADDIENFDDEDGIAIPTLLPKSANFNISVEVMEDASRLSSGAHIYGWIDWNQNGVWETSERIINQTSASIGVNNFTNIAVPANALIGVTYARIRLCTDTTCNVPTGLVANGEVDDYRVIVSDLSPDNTCDIVLGTEQNSSNGFDYAQLDTASNPALFSNIVSNLTVDGISSLFYINSIGMNREDGLIYGTFVDQNNAAGQTHLFATDRTGSRFIDLGIIRAEGPQQIQHRTHGVLTIFDQQALTLSIEGKNIGPLTMGDVSVDGKWLYTATEDLKNLIRIDLQNSSYKSIAINDYLAGGDVAFNINDGLLYNLDIENGILRQISVNTGNVDSFNLDYGTGLLPVDGTGDAISGGLVMDNGISLYAFVDNGNHDSNKSGSYDVLDRSAIYRINITTKEIDYYLTGSDANRLNSDTAGCFYARDYSDAPISGILASGINANYGVAYHSFSDTGADNDPALDGDQDLTLGILWDSEVAASVSADAKGDDLQGIDDEDGASVPEEVIVNTQSAIAINLSQPIGYLNVWIDVNGDGSFHPTDEHFINEQSINNTNTQLDLTIDPSATQGFSGDTFARFRFCSQVNDCNTPTGAANDGEVEDYIFTLINQILLQGRIFEDNGKGTGAIAHDGLIQVDELGLAKFNVKIVYNDAIAAGGFSQGDQIEQVVTEATGAYQLTVPVSLSNKDLLLQVTPQAKWIDISESNNGQNTQVTIGSVTDNQMQINAAAGDTLTGLNFGKVTAPQLAPDNFSEVEPGSQVLYAHQFNVNTAGIVDFSIIQDAANDSTWVVNLFSDDNCNGAIDSGDVATSAGIAVNSNSNNQLCIISRITVPTDATINQNFSYQLQAQMTYADSASTGHNVVKLVSDTDGVRASFSGAGDLQLSKTVKNITQVGVAGTSNFAKPGDVLEYTIYFANIGSGNITQVNIFDTTPEFTTLSNAVICGSGLPSANGCTVTVPSLSENTSGYAGSINWQISGSVAAGATGSVSYRVIVD